MYSMCLCACKRVKDTHTRGGGVEGGRMPFLGTVHLVFEIESLPGAWCLLIRLDGQGGQGGLVFVSPTLGF